MAFLPIAGPLGAIEAGATTAVNPALAGAAPDLGLLLQALPALTGGIGANQTPRVNPAPLPNSQPADMSMIARALAGINQGGAYPGISGKPAF